MRGKLVFGATVLAVAAVVSPQAEAAGVHIHTNSTPTSSNFDWSGFYVGGKLGWGTGHEHDNLRPTPLPSSSSSSSSSSDADNIQMGGLLGGVYAGHNWQSDKIVVGIEGELDGLNLTGSQTFNTNGVTGTLSITSNFQGFAKVRAGYAVDSALFYVTAGVGLANATLTATGSGAYAGINGSDSGYSLGYTVGAGLEYALNDKWSIRGEVDFSSFGAHTYNLGSTYNPTSASWDQTTFTVGASYRF